MKEEWKRYRDSSYEISSEGRIRNYKTGHILKAHKKHNGKKENDYVRVRIKVDGEKKTKSIHRMVAECFLENYSDDLEVNHKNSIKNDNRLCNLEMTTKEENYQHSLIEGNGSQRKPVCAVDADGNGLEFKSLWAAARFIKDELGVDREIDKICTNIKYSIKGKCKSAYGYVWEWITN